MAVWYILSLYTHCVFWDHIQHRLTRCNIRQHVTIWCSIKEAKCYASSVGWCCPNMLHLFKWALSYFMGKKFCNKLLSILNDSNIVPFFYSCHQAVQDMVQLLVMGKNLCSTELFWYFFTIIITFDLIN